MFDRRSTTGTLATVVVGLPAVVAANLLPLVGVIAWGWNLGSLLVLYWLEGAATVLLAALKSLFAERGSTGMPSRVEPLHELRAKRGGWRIREGWPPVYPRNVPIAASILGVWVVTVLPLSALYWLSVDLSVPVSAGLALGVGALVFSHAAAFVVDYIRAAEYREVSAAELAGTPALLAVVVLFVGVVSFDADRSGALAVLVVVVLGKTAASAYRFSTDHLRDDGGWLDGWLPDNERSAPPPELDGPEAPVSARVTVDARSVLAGSVGAIGYGFANRLGLGVVAAFVLSLFVGELWLSALAAVPIAIVVTARVLSYYLRYGTIEYQRRGDALVAYDTLLGEPQWVANVYGADFAVKNMIVDRFLKSGTLTVSGVESVDRGTVRFGPVSDLDAAVETLDLPVQRTDRPDRDPAVVVAAAVLAATFLVFPAALFFSPQVDDGTAAGITLVFAPFLLLPVGVLVWAGLSRI
jgi:hypothetical protein